MKPTLSVRVAADGGREVVIDTPHLWLVEQIDADGGLIRRACEVRTPADAPGGAPSDEGRCHGCERGRAAR